MDNPADPLIELLASLGIAEQDKQRQLAAEITTARASKSASDPKLPTELPARHTYPTWKKRLAYPELAKLKDPMKFFNAVWGAYAKAGLLFQPTLARLDPTFLRVLRAYCRYRHIDLNTVLPADVRELLNSMDGFAGPELRLGLAIARKIHAAANTP